MKLLFYIHRQEAFLKDFFETSRSKAVQGDCATSRSLIRAAPVPQSMQNFLGFKEA